MKVRDLATHPIELTRLDPATFEHLVNTIAIKILGMGVSSFAPGPDGGRDGYYEGEAEYPSPAEHWTGIWYIQSKFHTPSLSGDPQKWLQKQVRDEIQEFMRPESGRVIPDNWIIATNIDPSANPDTGTFDKVRAIINESFPTLAPRTHIWGGRKILDLLTVNQDIARHYGGLLTSGDVISAIVQSLGDASAGIDTILRHLVVTQLGEQQYTKLEQAGSNTGTRPGIQTLYTDLPFEYEGKRYPAVLEELSNSIAENHRPTNNGPRGPEWDHWRQCPSRSRVWFLRGGPGNGKSTITQYICQIHRAAIITSKPEIVLSPKVQDLTAEIQACAKHSGFWPLAPRVPIHIELRLYAYWYGTRPEHAPRGVLTYLAERFSTDLEQQVMVGTLKRALSEGRWLFVFDGLDEVPGDVKDMLANEVNKFIDDTLFSCCADAMIVCTSRPQGYSGQFDKLRPTLIALAKLSAEEALACADPVLAIDRSEEELALYRSTLREAIASPSVLEIMTTPLQSHIMAVVVRDGGRPPQRKWQLFSNFYQVIKKREANRSLADPKIAWLLREGDKLIKALHNRLGFELHYLAEKSTGAQTSISRIQLRKIISEIVHSLQDDEIDATIELLDEATTERLVLVNTPESGQTVRFDIRPLQEFFAAEYIYESANEECFVDRLRAIAADSHWREVMHFLLSALVEHERRGELAQAVQVLAEIDDAPADHHRQLARRLSIGGIIVLRLLREGVIESDKRTRALFRKCLPSLLASTDADLLLLSSPPGHSAAWLTGVALDTIAETAPTESIGAACLLPLLLPKSSQQSDQVARFLISCDELFFGVFVDSLARGRNAEKEKHTIPVWTLTLLLKRLLSESWQKLSRRTLYRIYNILEANQDRMISVALEMGLSSDIAKILRALFHSTPRHERSESRQRIAGLIEMATCEGSEELQEFLQSAGLRAKLANLGGLPRACALLATAAIDSSTEATQQLEEMLGGGDGLQLLPRSFRNLFLKSGECNYETEEIGTLIRREHLGYHLIYTIHSFNNETFKWEEVLATFPSIGVYYCTHSDDAKNPAVIDLFNWLKDKYNLQTFIKAIERTKFLVTLEELGGLIHNFPNSAGALKQLVANSPIRGLNESRAAINRPRWTFEMQLPADGALLPHLVTHVSSARSAAYPSSHEIIQVIREYVPNDAGLIAIWQDDKESRTTRAAAGVLLIAECSSGTMVDVRHYNRLLDLYDASISPWFVPGALKLVTPAIQLADPAALAFADQLLTLVRSDLRARCASENVIADWREITRAPVHATLSDRIWDAHTA